MPLDMLGTAVFHNGRKAVQWQTSVFFPIVLHTGMSFLGRRKQQLTLPRKRTMLRVSAL